MKKKATTLDLFYKKKFSDFLSHMIEAKKLKEESVHQTKKDIRYFKNLLFLFESMNIENKDLKKVIKQVRPLIKALREYRKIEVCNIVFEENKAKGAASIKRMLNKEQSEAGEKLIEQIDLFDLAKYKKRTKAISTQLKEIDNPDVPTFTIVKNEIDVVYKLLAVSHEGKNFKEMRKYLIIARCMMKLHLLLNDNEELNFASDKIDEFCSVLGLWKDKACLLEKMETVKLQTSSLSIKAVARTISNNLVTEMTKLEDELYSKMHKIELHKCY